jgi:hypothetical protein
VLETVQQVLAARIDRLSTDQKAAIQLAAVLGREFSLDLAEEVWDGIQLRIHSAVARRPGRSDRDVAGKPARSRAVWRHRPEVAALTYLLVAARMRGDVNEVRKAIGPVIERAREASLPEYEAIAMANRAWVAWRSGEERAVAADARRALDMWEGLPVRCWYDWMVLWPLAAMAPASGRTDEAIEHARAMLPPPQQALREPVRTLLADAVRAWDEGRAADAEQLLRRSMDAAGELDYL